MPLGMLFRFILVSCTAVKSALNHAVDEFIELIVSIDRMLIVSILATYRCNPSVFILFTVLKRGYPTVQGTEVHGI